MKYISSSSYLGRGGRRRLVADDDVVVAVDIDSVEALVEDDEAVVVGVIILELLKMGS